MADLTAFSRADADRILRRAAEIDGSGDTGPVSLSELRSIAGEAGFGKHAIDRAIEEAQQASLPRTVREPVQRSGILVTHLSTVRSIPVQVTSEQLMRAVRLFQPYRDGPANINLGAREITWQDLRGLRFFVTSGGGVTDVRVVVSRVLLRRARWTRWVESAADQLETLIRLTAAEPRDRRAGQALPKGVG